MRRQRVWSHLRIVLLTAFIVIGGGSGTVFATTSSSTHYQVDQTQFGAGSTAQSCSTQYCSQVSIGAGAAGDTKGSTVTAKLGPVTNGQPRLEVVLTPGPSDLGILTTDHTATSTTSVQVLSYLSSGYTLQIVGNAPTYGGHTLATPSTPTASTQGTEQFGINAVANTSPSVGAGPVQIPSTSTSFGVVNTNYGTANLFMYNSGDEVAHSLSASGATNYTISMMVNISDSTPAGDYSADFSAVVIPVF